MRAEATAPRARVLPASRARALHFAARGWVLGAMLTVLAAVRWASSEPLAPAWLALWAAGLGWRAWGGFHIGAHANGRSMDGASIARGGPYRVSRHPLYAANLLAAAGLVLYANCLPAWGAAVFLGLAFLHHEALARAEEAYLLARWGEAYRSYMRVTPRWPGPRSLRAWAYRAEGADGADPARDVPIPFRIRTALALQGPNLAKACAGAILIRIAAAVSG